MNDTEKIRIERKKARVNRNKYQGVGSETMMGSGGGGGGGSSRFGGFGSDGSTSGGLSFSATSGIGGISAASSSGYYDEDERPNRYESSKYDDFDDVPSGSGSSPSRSSPAKPSSTTATASKKEVNLFDFEDEPKASSSAKDDDWGDFASGNAAPTTSATGKKAHSLLDF